MKTEQTPSADEDLEMLLKVPDKQLVSGQCINIILSKYFVLSPKITEDTGYSRIPSLQMYISQ